MTDVRVLRPREGWSPVDARELWQARELLFFLIWRDVRVRYRQTALGALWAVLQPVLAVTLFTVLFGRLIGVQSDGIPYPLFALAGLIPWNFFAHGVGQGAVSLVHNEQLVRRVYFPRLVIPAGAVFAGAIDVSIAMLMLIGLAASYGIVPTLAWALIPFLLLLTGVAALAVAIILAALNVRYRDVQQIVPFFVQLLMFASPVVYSSTLVTGPWRALYALNPLVGIIDGMRWALFAHGAAPVGAMLTSLVVSSLLLVGATFVFRRAEHTFADVI